MIYRSRGQASRETGISYLGSVNLTAKHIKAFKYNELTYSLYLSPADTSGYEVCPLRTKECTHACLNESGLNKIDTKHNKINKSRISKTKLFFENRDFFMSWIIDEITAAKNKANRLGMRFSVRLNNTSDISPEQFSINGKNILEIFNDSQFYDYSKVYRRIDLAKKYNNYDLTFSYSGDNKEDCIRAIEEDNTRVAVVFKDEIPKKFWGYDVLGGDEYDMRYYDPKDIIIGLLFKEVRNEIDFENSSFVN